MIVESPKQKLQRQIQEDIRLHKPIMSVNGALGDDEYCEGFVEGKPIEPPTGGRFTKFYGCHALFKGYPLASMVDLLGMAKGMISVIPRRIIGKSKYLMAALGLRYLFFRKQFWHEAHIYASTMYIHTVEKAGLPADRYNTFTKELKRAVNAALEKMVNKEGIVIEYLEDKNDKSKDWLTNVRMSGDKVADNYIVRPIGLVNRIEYLITKREMWETIATLAEFVYLFMEYDNAYRMRLQSILMLLDKEAVKKDVFKEFRRLYQTLINWEDEVHGIRYKWLELKPLIYSFLFIDKRAKEFLKEFLLELDVDKVKLDEDDHYFVLKRRTFNFYGRSYDDRLAERKRIDKEKGNYRVALYTYSVEDPITHKQVQKNGLKVEDW